MTKEGFGKWITLLGLAALALCPFAIMTGHNFAADILGSAAFIFFIISVVNNFFLIYKEQFSKGSVDNLKRSKNSKKRRL